MLGLGIQTPKGIFWPYCILKISGRSTAKKKPPKLTALWIHLIRGQAI